MAVLLPLLGPEPLPPFTRQDLPGLGLTRHGLDALLRAGLVVQPLRGAYLDARCADDLVARAGAAARVLPPGAAVAGRIAAWIHGFDARGPGERDTALPLECVVPAGITVPQRTGLRAREARLVGEDVVTVAGVPVTSAARTALDLARFLPCFMGLAVLDAMAHAGLVDAGVLADRVGDFPRGRGVRQARRLIELCEPATESFGESWLRLRLVDAGFPRPEPQIWIVDARGVALYRLDMGWAERRIAVEYDGEEFHSAPENRLRDAVRRERLAREFGWHAVGVGRGEVLGTSLELERGVGELLGLEPQLRRRRW